MAFVGSTLKGGDCACVGVGRRSPVSLLELTEYFITFFQVLGEICEQGYSDALRFLKENGTSLRIQKYNMVNRMSVTMSGLCIFVMTI